MVYRILLCFIFLFPLHLFGSTEESLAFRESITVEGIRAHQKALQDIATHNNGNRMAGTSGFSASVAYVKTQLEAASYQVRLQDFSINLSEDNTPPILKIISPEEKVFAANVDFSTMSAQGAIEIDGVVEAVDLKIPSPAVNGNNSGCELSDFSNFTRGNIALIQRGSCPFANKVANALRAGAVGVIIFNEGSNERTAMITSRLSETSPNFPVIGASFAVGEALYGNVLNGPTGIRVHMKVDVSMNTRIVQNVIAETKGGDASRVVVIGGHLDSVREGPGLNDNGSGSGTILKMAEKFAELGLTPKNKLRFIWFAAEEFGLLGSEYYVNSLAPEEQDHILAMLNFDMLGSSNYARFVYDGDNSSHTTPMAEAGPNGSAAIEHIFLDYFSSLNLVTHPTAFDGRSDYGPFIQVGIPAGGLFSGAEGLKSARLAQIYGGRAHQPFDPCYHRACDDFQHTDGLNGSLALKSMDELSDAAAHALFTLANTDQNLHPKGQPRKVMEFEYRGGLMVK